MAVGHGSVFPQTTLTSGHFYLYFSLSKLDSFSTVSQLKPRIWHTVNTLQLSTKCILASNHKMGFCLWPGSLLQRLRRARDEGEPFHPARGGGGNFGNPCSVV